MTLPTEVLIAYLGDQATQIGPQLWFWYCVICLGYFTIHKEWLRHKHPHLCKPPNVRLNMKGVPVYYGTR